MNFFFGLLKKLGSIAGRTAPDLISLVNPVLGAWIGTFLQSVTLTEAKLGPGNGEAKKLEAINAVQVAMPLLLTLMKNTTDRELVNPEKLTSAVEKLIDGVVELLNAFGLFPKKA